MLLELVLPLAHVQSNSSDLDCVNWQRLLSKLQVNVARAGLGVAVAGVGVVGVVV